MAATLYKYKGRSSTGEKVKGRFSGDLNGLKSMLRSQGVLLTHVEEVQQRQKSGGIKEADFLAAIEQLYHLLTSGMRLDDALKVLVTSQVKKSASDFWELVLQQVKQGEMLSDAVTKASEESEGWRVSRLYSQILAVGEQVGELPAALKRLLDHLEFRKTLSSELISSLSYPLFLLVMSAVAVLIVVTVIVPRFASIFTPEQMTNLPLISKMVFSLTVLGDAHGRLISLIFFVFISGVFLYRRELMPILRRLLVRILQAFPLTKKPLMHLDLADVFTAVGVMLEGGVGLHRSLSQSSMIARLPALRHLMQTTAAAVKEGQTIFSSWQTSSLISREDASLIAVGESSASLGTICLQLGERHMQQFKVSIKRIMALFEPMLIMCVGVVIGLIVTGILLAVMTMTDVTGM